jgi:hypothetical protein
VVEEVTINWGAWFMQKLKNEITILQKKACKLGNNLIKHALTIIGKVFVDKCAKE